MISSVISYLSILILEIIKRGGYVGLFLLMAIQNANIPIPSEIILPFSGFLVSAGEFSMTAVILWSTIGSLVGSLLSYFLASWILKNRKKYKLLEILISDIFLEKAEKWFGKYGAVSVGFSRVLPIVRTFISLPAGLGRMNLVKFSIYTTIGSFVWSVALVYFGWLFGENWIIIKQYTAPLEYAVALLILAAGAFWVYAHFIRGRKSND